MTKEEIIAQFQGSSETVPAVYIFNGSLQQLQEVANTSIRTFSTNGILYFMSMAASYSPNDIRMEAL